MHLKLLRTALMSILFGVFALLETETYILSTTSGSGMSHDGTGNYICVLTNQITGIVMYLCM